MQITSQKARKRANRDMDLVERQIAQNEIARLAAIADVERTHAQTHAFLSRQADEIKAAIEAYDSKPAKAEE